MAYIAVEDIEAVFGKSNIMKWADLDNDENAAVIEARIETAIAWACNEIDSRLRGNVYAIPITGNSDGAIPLEIVDIAANLAGVWLYENRGVQDSNPETGQATHRLTWNRRRAEHTIREIQAGLRELAAVRVGNGRIPKAVND